MKYRYKIEIELDDEKIIREGKYEIADIYATIRSWFAEEDIPEVKNDSHTLTFISARTDRDDFARMGLVEVSLIKAKWFKPYVTKMLWYESNYGEGYVEDIIKEDKAYLKRYGERS